MTGSVKKNMFNTATQLTSSDNLNSLTTNGLFYCLDGNDPVGLPEQAGHWLIMNLAYGRGGAQIAFMTYSTRQMWVRIRHWDSYTAWTKMIG